MEFRNAPQEWLEDFAHRFWLENRLLNKGAEALKTYEKIVAESEVIREHIDENIPLDERYKRFRGNSEDALILQAVIRHRKRLRPDARAGLTGNSPNLDRVAEKRGENAPENMEAQEKLYRAVSRYKVEAQDTLKELGPRPEVNDIHSAAVDTSNSELYNGRAVATHYLEDNINNDYKLAEHFNKTKKNNYYTVVQAFQNNRFPASPLDVAAQKESTLSAVTAFSAALTQAEKNVQQVETLLKQGEIGILNNNKTAAENASDVQQYLSYLQKNTIARLQKHLDFAKKAYLYLTAYEKTPRIDQGIEIGPINPEAELTTLKRQKDMVKPAGLKELIPFGFKKETLKEFTGFSKEKVPDTINYSAAIFTDGTEINLSLRRLIDSDDKVKKAFEYVDSEQDIEIEDEDILKPAENDLLNKANFDNFFFEDSGDKKNIRSLRKTSFENLTKMTRDLERAMTLLDKAAQTDTQNLQALSGKINGMKWAINTPVNKKWNQAEKRRHQAEKRTANKYITPVCHLHNVILLRLAYYSNLRKQIEKRYKIAEGIRRKKPEYQPKDRTRRIEQIDSSLAELPAAISKAEEDGNAEEVAKLHLEMEALKTEKKILEMRVSGSVDRHRAEIREIVNGSPSYEREAVRLTMDEYLLVRNQLAAAGQLPKTRAERAKKIAETMLYGVGSTRKMTAEEAEMFEKEIEAQGLDGLSEYEKLAAANKVNIYGAFDRYFTKGYWAKAETNISGWEKDFDAKTPVAGLIVTTSSVRQIIQSNNTVPVAVKVLGEVLAATDGNNQFLVDLLTTSDAAKHQRAKEMLRSIIGEFERMTAIRKQDLAEQIDYENDIYEEGNTLTERFNAVSRRVIDGMFGPGVPISKRLAYGMVAYLVVFKGVFGNTPFWSKLVMGAGGALGLGLIYEDVTGKAALGFLGIDSPEEAADGTWLSQNAKNSGVEYNDKAGYRALDTLKSKNVEDVLAWYERQGELGRTEDLGYSARQSLLAEGLLTAKEIREIFPDEENPERAALKFVDVVEKQLMYYGEKATRGTVTGRRELIQAGRKELAKFTAEGAKKAAENGEVTYLSPSEKTDLVDGGYKWTWKHATQILETSHDYIEAEKKRSGVMAAPSWVKAQWEDLKGEALPGWLKATDYLSEFTDRSIERLGEFGADARETLEEYGAKGWKFSIEKKNELKLWWKEHPNAVRIRKMADGTWNIVKTGVKLPFIATLEVGDRAITGINEAINKVDEAASRWAYGVRRLSFDLKPSLTNLDKMADDRRGKDIETAEAFGLKYNFIANGYELLGKYETEFFRFQTDAKGVPVKKTFEGIFSREGLFEPNSDARINFYPPEKGYITFVGLELNTSGELTEDEMMVKAYQEGIHNLVRFLKKAENAKYINKNTPFWKAVETGNEDLINKHIAPLVERFGAFVGRSNGYMLMMKVPIPLIAKYLNAQKATIKKRWVKGANGKLVQKDVEIPIMNNDEYFLKTSNRWRYGKLEKEKHSIIYSPKRISHDILKFLPIITRGGKEKYWTERYQKEFCLWQDTHVEEFATQANAAADGYQITEFGNKSGVRAQFFQRLRSEFETEWLENKHFTRSVQKTSDQIKSNMGTKEAAQFDKWHDRLWQTVQNPGPRELFEKYLLIRPDKVLTRYRIYLVKNLIEAKLNEVTAKQKGAKTLVDFYSKQFVEEEMESLLTGVPTSLVKTAGKLIEGLTLILTEISNIGEEDARAIKNKIMGKVKKKAKKAAKG